MRKRVNGTVQSYFLWDGDRLAAELTGTGGKVAEYGYYPGLDNLHTLIIGATRYWAHGDGRGNVIGLTDGSKVLTRSYVYDEWGKLIGGADVQPFNNADRARFKGTLWMGPEVELYYMRNRWYEPHSGRFLSDGFPVFGLGNRMERPWVAGAVKNGVESRGHDGFLTIVEALDILLEICRRVGTPRVS